MTIRGRLKAAYVGLMHGPVATSDAAGMREILSTSAMSERAVLSLSTVWACTRLISETIATLPLSMYERASAGRRVAGQHPLQMVLHNQPNPESTAAVYWESVVAAMLLRGNAYSEKLMDGPRLLGLQFLDPRKLTVERFTNGTKRWHYRRDNGEDRVIPAERIWHVPGFTLDGKDGVSVVEYGAAVFGSALASSTSAAGAFSNGLMQPLYYKTANWLKPAQRDEFEKSLRGKIEQGRTPILEGGIDVQSVGLKPIDAQLLESRAFSVEEIARWFRVPPHMIGHTEKSTSWGTGVEQQMIGFLMFTLNPWLRRIEQAISKDLLVPSERLRYYPKFAVEGLLRADSQARGEFYSKMVNNGIMTRDEVRELEDREPLGGNAAVLTVQSAMTTLDSVGSAQ